jgi:hypothetical protein
MTNLMDLRYTTWDGGVPIFDQGQLFGALGESSLP